MKETLLVVVALVLLAGGAFAVVESNDDDDDPGSDRASSTSDAGSASGDDSGGGEGAQELETWAAAVEAGIHGTGLRTLVVDSNLVFIAQRSGVSFDRRTGEQNWYGHLEELDGPAGELVVCGVGTVPSEQQTVPITFGVDSEPAGNLDPVCGHIGLMDLATGELDLVVEVAPGEPSDPYNNGLPTEIVGDTVFVVWYGSVFGLDGGDLSTRWRWEVSSGSGRPSDCEVTDMVVGEAESVVVLSQCEDDNFQASYFVDELGTTGEVGRSHQLTEDEVGLPFDSILTLELLSASPVVVHTLTGARSLVTLDDSWNALSTIQGELTDLESDRALWIDDVGLDVSRTGEWHDTSNTLVSGNTLVSFTEPRQEADNQLVALDLATGQERWTTGLDPGFTIWQVVAIDEGRAIVLAGDRQGPALSVVTVDLASGEVLDETTTEDVLTADGDPIPEWPDPGITPAVGYHAFAYADGRVYGVDYDPGAGTGDQNQPWVAYTVG